MLPLAGFANSTEEKAATPTETTDVKSGIKEFINHHLLDSHSFYFNADKETGEHNGFSLPIILWDNGLQVFSSGEFHHGPVADVAEHNGNFYKLHHEKYTKQTLQEN